MKYRKKIEVIEAFQLGLDINYYHYPSWFGEMMSTIEMRGSKMYEWHLMTMKGKRFIVGPGDYIIQDIKNEFYPCKPDIFEQTYERYAEYDNSDKEIPNPIISDIRHLAHDMLFICSNKEISEPIITHIKHLVKEILISCYEFSAKEIARISSGEMQ